MQCLVLRARVTRPGGVHQRSLFCNAFRRIVRSVKDLLNVQLIVDELLDLGRELRVARVQMLAEDDLILAQVLLRRVSLHLLHGHLVLKEFFGCSLESLLFDRAWYVAFLEDAPRNEHIVIDLVIVGS